MTKETGLEKRVGLGCIMVAILCLWFVPAYGATLEEAERLGAFVVELYEQGRFREAMGPAEKALAIYKEALGEKHPDTATSYNNLGELYKAVGDYGKAEPMLQKALSIREKALGEKHPDIARSYDSLGMLHQSVGDYVKAEPMLQKALSIREKALGEKHPDTALSYNNLGGLYDSMGDYSRAQPLFQKALSIWKEVLGEKHPLTASSYNNLGALYDSMRDYAKAEPLYQKALAIRREVLGEKHPHTASSYYRLGVLYWSMGNYAKAEPLYQKALSIRKEVLGEKHPDTAGSYGSLGLLYSYMGDYAKAEPILQKALAIEKEVLGEKHPETARSYNNLGMLHYFMGDYGKAEPLYQKALAIWKEAVGEKHQDIATSYNNLGALYDSMRDYAKAEPLHLKALAIVKEVDGEKHPRTAASYNNLGGHYKSTGDYARAEPLCQKALAIMKEVLGEKHPDTAGSYGSLGELYSDMGDYAKAEPLYRKALSIRKDVLGEKHPDTASSYNNLGWLYHSMGDYAKAEPLYRKALAIRRDVFGEKHPDTANSYNNLGGLFLSMGKVDAAMSIIKKTGTSSAGLGHCYLAKGDYKTAIAQFEESFSYTQNIGDKQFLIADCTGLGLSYEGLRNYGSAKDYYKKAVDLIEAQRGALIESQRRTFFAGKAGAFSRLEPYEGLVRVSIHLKDAGEAFYWAENTRARVLLESMSRRPSGSAIGIPSGVAREEESLVNRIAAKHKQMEIALEKMPDRVKGLEQELGSLRIEQQSLISRLRRDYPEYASIKYPQALRAKDVPLKPGEVMIEYEVTEKATFAWVIRGKDVVKTASIPVTRKELNEKVKTYRKCFEGVTSYQDLSRFDPSAGKSLYDLVFSPLATHLKEGESLFIVPDEILCTLPFEMLVVDLPKVPKTGSGKYGSYPEGVRYLGDGYRISYCQSATALSVGRSLRKGRGGEGGKMLVVADPVFDVKDARVTGKEKTQLAQRDDFQVSRMVAVSKAMGGGEEFRRLIKTGKLANDLKRAYGDKVDALQGLDATEEGLRKRPLGQYRYEVFATHGILDNQIAYIQEPALVLSQVGVDAQDRKRDGFLTMSEVMELKLNAEVAALTACSTGMGKSLSGEGVMHMGRAFQYAGAKSVLMSLWSVEEVSTTLLAERFFAYLKEGKGNLDALRLARTDVRKAGYEHPYFWAPFILMGE